MSTPQSSKSQFSISSILHGILSTNEQDGSASKRSFSEDLSDDVDQKELLKKFSNVPFLDLEHKNAVKMGVGDTSDDPKNKLDNIDLENKNSLNSDALVGEIFKARPEMDDDLASNRPASSVDELLDRRRAQNLTSGNFVPKFVEEKSNASFIDGSLGLGSNSVTLTSPEKPNVEDSVESSNANLYNVSMNVIYIQSHL